MNDDRRQCPRQNLASLIYLDLERNNGGIVLDLSEGGMQISVANPLAASGEIRFSLCLETQKRIEGSGRIAWISSSGKCAGVRFDSLPPHALSQIRQCLSMRPTATTADPPATATPEAAPPAEAIAGPVSSIPASRERDAGEQNEALEGATAEFPEDGSRVPEEMAGEGSRAERPTPAEQGVTADLDANPAQEGKQTSVADERPAGGNGTLARPDRAKPAPPPWLEKLIRAGRREEFDEEVSYGEYWMASRTDAGCGRPDEAETVRGERADGEESESQEFAPAPLYLPNYRIGETDAGEGQDGDHGEIQLRTAAQLACERFEEFGWTLERDWHIWLALVLLAAGFLALAQNPPLTVLSGTLWIASAVIALKRKQKPRPPGQGDRNRQ